MTVEASLLADGRRLHLHQGPIDLIVEAFGGGRRQAYDRAYQRFDGLLSELVDELPGLRRAAEKDRVFNGSVARRMQRAVIPYLPEFVTPMAAVAGAVADEILAAMNGIDGISKIYVNNGGDTAFFLGPGQRMTAAMAGASGGRINIDSKSPCRGVATSGWRGRSLSLGIADAVSTVGHTAALADVAATMIANAVDLPGHPAITRAPANTLAPDSDLGERLVTDHVGLLSARDVARALDRGERYARGLARQDKIAGAMLTLQDQVRQVGAAELMSQQTGERTYA